MTSQGVDLAFDIAPIENLVFNAGVTGAETEYDDFRLFCRSEYSYAM